MRVARGVRGQARHCVGDRGDPQPFFTSCKLQFRRLVVPLDSGGLTSGFWFHRSRGVRHLQALGRGQTCALTGLHPFSVPPLSSLLFQHLVLWPLVLSDTTRSKSAWLPGDLEKLGQEKLCSLKKDIFAQKPTKVGVRSLWAPIACQ